MTEEDFIQSILAEPDNEGLHLVYADWLEERGFGPGNTAKQRHCRVVLVELR